MTGDEPLVDPELLERLACPKTHHPLKLAGPDVVEAVNKAVEEGRLVNQAGKKVEEKVDGVLLVEGENLAYPIRDKIPILLVEEGFSLPG